MQKLSLTLNLFFGMQLLLEGLPCTTPVKPHPHNSWDLSGSFIIYVGTLWSNLVNWWKAFLATTALHPWRVSFLPQLLAWWFSPTSGRSRKRLPSLLVEWKVIGNHSGSTSLCYSTRASTPVGCSLFQEAPCSWNWLRQTNVEGIKV